MSRQSPPTLDIEVIDDVIRVAGDLDLSTAPCLHAALVEALRRGPSRLALDLTALNFCDSSGLSTLVHARSQLSAPGELVLHGASEQLRQLLRITNLDSSFTLT
jgi:anti-sigma B factor antagonist